MVTPVLRELAESNPVQFLAESSLSHNPGEDLIDAWNHVCARVLGDGTVEELHATRDDYQAILLGHLKILDGSLTLLDRLRSDLSYPEAADELRGRRDRLQKHHDSLFPRWQSQDDLEAILLERISLPNEQLKALAAKNPPPQSWYDEAGDAS